jgi:hypothetical protein
MLAAQHPQSQVPGDGQHLARPTPVSGYFNVARPTSPGRAYFSASQQRPRQSILDGSPASIRSPHDECGPRNPQVGAENRIFEPHRMRGTIRQRNRGQCALAGPSGRGDSTRRVMVASPRREGPLDGSGDLFRASRVPPAVAVVRAVRWFLAVPWPDQRGRRRTRRHDHPGGLLLRADGAMRPGTALRPTLFPSVLAFFRFLLSMPGCHLAYSA